MGAPPPVPGLDVPYVRSGARAARGRRPPAGMRGAAAARGIATATLGARGRRAGTGAGGGSRASLALPAKCGCRWSQPLQTYIGPTCSTYCGPPALVCLTLLLWCDTAPGAPHVLRRCLRATCEPVVCVSVLGSPVQQPGSRCQPTRTSPLLTSAQLAKTELPSTAWPPIPSGSPTLVPSLLRR